MGGEEEENEDKKAMEEQGGNAGGGELGMQDGGASGRGVGVTGEGGEVSEGSEASGRGEGSKIARKAEEAVEAGRAGLALVVPSGREVGGGGAQRGGREKRGIEIRSSKHLEWRGSSPRRLHASTRPTRQGRLACVRARHFGRAV